MFIILETNEIRIFKFFFYNILWPFVSTVAKRSAKCFECVRIYSLVYWRKNEQNKYLHR